MMTKININSFNFESVSEILSFFWESPRMKNMLQLFELRSAKLYIGKWSASVPDVGSIVIKEEAHLNLVEYDNVLVDYENIFIADLWFQNGTKVKFDKPPIKIFGMKYPDSDNILLFNFYTTKQINMSSLLKLAKKSLLTENGDFYPNITVATEKFSRLLQTQAPNVSLIGLEMHRNLTYKKNTKFHPGKKYIGNCITCKFNLTFKLEYFDHIEFIKECKIFGVVVAFITILNYYAYRLIEQNARSPNQLNKLSVYSLVMCLSFDYNFALYAFNVSNNFPNVSVMFIFLYTANVFIYFSIQIGILFNVWKTQVIANINNNLENIRREWVSFFTLVSISMLLMTSASNLVFEFPILSIFLIESQFIPQIFRSIKRNEFNIISSPGISLVTLVRIIQIWYFGIYKNNLEEMHAPTSSIIFICVLIVQLICILILNYYGGQFFLPASMRPKSFDYESIPVPPNSECAICLCNIEDGEQTMVTPCGHPFHRNCLLRWMQEQPICPICRADLLPFSPDLYH